MFRIWQSQAGLLLLAVSLFSVGAPPSYAQDRASGAETFVPAGWEIEDKVRGDLTGDKLDDLVLVLKKKDEPQASRMLLVLVQKSDGSFEQIGANNALLLCEECFGAMGGAPEISITDKAVLIVDQLAGSRETSHGIWRFRFDPAERKMRLIGLDIEYTDRGDGSGTKESTNYLTGKRIRETWAYSEKKQAAVMTKSSTTSVSTSKTFLEQVTSKDF